MEILLGSTPVHLLPNRAAFLPSSKSLIVADLHVGKSATFRKRGLAVPEGTTKSDLSKLSEIVRSSGARQVVIAGDLVHSADGLSSSILNWFSNWLEEIQTPVVLTEGNHDARSWLGSRNLAMEIVPSLQLENLLITHDPDDLPPGTPGIAGHLHPGARISESARNSLRIAGFYLRDSEHLVLPAFSEFTGIHPVKFGKTDRFFAEMNEKISEIPHKLL